VFYVWRRRHYKGSTPRPEPEGRAERKDRYMLPKYPIVRNPKIEQKTLKNELNSIFSENLGENDKNFSFTKKNSKPAPKAIFCQKSLFSQNLPTKPYCADYLEMGLRIRSTESALKHRYIQPNHPNSKLWLLFDVDRPTCVSQTTDELNLPAPTLFVQNPKNHHAHLLYALETPVHFNENSSLKAIRFAGAVDVSMSRTLGADAGYSGLICKNPLNEYWRTYAVGGAYDLHELAEYLDLKKYNDRRTHLPEIGLGRNCTLFDKTRKWSYKAIREFFGATLGQWEQEVFEQALCYNTGFESQLAVSEVKATAKSIAKYTWLRFSPQEFSRIQSERGKRSGQARLELSEDKRTTAIEMDLNGIKRVDIAKALNVSKGTISKWLNKKVS